VERLAWLIAELARAHGTRQVVDLGSGQGYLSRALAYQHGLDVLAVDADDVQTCGAQRYQRQTERHARRVEDRAPEQSQAYQPNVAPQGDSVAGEGEGNMPARGVLVHATHRVTERSLDELLAALHAKADHGTAGVSTEADEPPSGDASASAPARDDHRSGRVPWLLCGLHTCGDLAPSSLRLFVESDAHLLVNVGCCYNLLTESAVTSGANDQTNAGFPMSHWLRTELTRQGEAPSLGLTARHLACQAPGRWPSQAEATHQAFERNYYRALLHLFMVEHGMAAANVDAPRIGQLGRKPLPTFAAYAIAALRKLARSDRLSADQSARLHAFLAAPGDDPQAPAAVLEAFAAQHADGRRQVAAFWTLRALLAPALERLLLQDRVHYLREQGHDAWIIALFDPQASPRNLALVSVKTAEPAPVHD
ncbi:methyltransferase domain-containing protein, partial [Thamnocephalis sphaerospora]